MTKFKLNFLLTLSKLQKRLIKVINKHYNNALMMIKKKTIKQVLVMENLIKNFKNGALSRYLIKNIKKYFIKTFIKNFKKAPHQKTTSSRSLKMPNHET